MKRKGNFSVITISFGVLLIFQVLCLIWANLTQVGKSFDSDAGMIMNHVMMMAKEKALLIPGWDYLTTLEFDCTTLFALPLYLLTHNIYLACGLSNLLLFGLFAYAIFYLFRGQEIIYPILAVNLILVPYRIGALDYYNMLFFRGAQYGVKVMTPLLLVGLLLHAGKNEKEKADKKSIFSFVLYLFFAFLTAFSSGIYVFACGLFPALAVYAIYKFFMADRIRLNEIALFAGTILCSGIGFLLNLKCQTAKGNSMTFIHVQDAWTNVQKSFFGIFELLGGAANSSEVTVLSLEGIGILMKILLTIALLCGTIYAMCRYGKEEKDLFALLALAVAIWNFFVLCITNTRYGSDTSEYRYHLIGLIPVFCIFSRTILDSAKRLRNWQRLTIAALGLLVLTYLSVTGIQLFPKHDTNAELKEVISYCKEEGFDTVFFLYDRPRAENARVLDQSQMINYLELTADGTSCVRNYYAEYNGRSIMEEENYAIVIEDDAFEWGDVVDYNGIVLLKKVAKVADSRIYVPMDLEEYYGDDSEW
ncbi:MAG: hypothetical protein J5721_02395 [Lachnospiraceae bacterium]|nr:hypothetical protein [Lachnospiraceae bacterium]